jgi:hypothetical protein
MAVTIQRVYRGWRDRVFVRELRADTTGRRIAAALVIQRNYRVCRYEPHERAATAADSLFLWRTQFENVYLLPRAGAQTAASCDIDSGMKCTGRLHMYGRLRPSTC